MNKNSKDVDFSFSFAPGSLGAARGSGRSDVDVGLDFKMDTEDLVDDPVDANAAKTLEVLNTCMNLSDGEQPDMCQEPLLVGVEQEKERWKMCTGNVL